MQNGLMSIFNNDSPLGRFMTKVWIIVASNLMFILFSLPVFTIGAAWTAMSYVNLRCVRYNEINPIKDFWESFLRCFKRSTMIFIIYAALALFLMLEIYATGKAEGMIFFFRFPLCGILAVLFILAVHTFPVIAVFNDPVRDVIRNSIVFSVQNIGKTIILFILYVIPAGLTYLFSDYAPLFAFIWFFFGFGLISFLTSKLLHSEFAPYISDGDCKRE